MRILQVIHQFPPHSSQGSEVYCYALSRALSQTDDVRVFHVATVPKPGARRLVHESHAGLTVHHCVDGAEYARLADWPNPFLGNSFRAVLDDFRPQIVHLHNYLSLGDDLASRARAHGAAVVYTLHDFGLICPNTLLLRDDGRLCGKQTGDFFQDCCPTLIRTTGSEQRTAPWVARLPSLARWQLYARQQPRPLRRLLLGAAAAAFRRWQGDPSRTHVERKRDFFLTRTRRMFRDVDLFLAPSRFLMERYVACGLPQDKIVYAPYGMRRFSVPERLPRSGAVRFGYLGGLHPHKGIELLLQAFEGVGDGATLHVHGSVFGSPISANYWQRIRRQQAPAVFFHGAYDNDQVGDVLAGIDVLVVPSLWYENAPLTIHEAFLAGVPVITAGSGGMAELVRDGIDGLHFRLGDAADLRRALRQVAAHPEHIDTLRRGIRPVAGIEEHAAEMRERYRALASAPPDIA